MSDYWVPLKGFPGTERIEGKDCTIELTPRPHYCDRGNFLATIDSRGNLHRELDWADGWPRYYFDQARAKAEIEAWLRKRGQWVDPELSCGHLISEHKLENNKLICPAEKIDIRPNCIVCGKPWMPAEGENAQKWACLDCRGRARLAPKPSHDAPHGMAFHCTQTGCTSWYVLAENVHAHRIATGHGAPTLGPIVGTGPWRCYGGCGKPLQDHCCTQPFEDSSSCDSCAGCARSEACRRIAQRRVCKCTHAFSDHSDADDHHLCSRCACRDPQDPEELCPACGFKLDDPDFGKCPAQPR